MTPTSWDDENLNRDVILSDTGSRVFDPPPPRTCLDLPGVIRLELTGRTICQVKCVRPDLPMRVRLQTDLDRIGLPAVVGAAFRGWADHWRDFPDNPAWQPDGVVYRAGLNVCFRDESATAPLPAAAVDRSQEQL